MFSANSPSLFSQALSQKVSSVISSVEDTLGVPSPQDLAKKGEGEDDEEVKRLEDSECYLHVMLFPD